MRIVLHALAGACLLLPVPVLASDSEAGRMAEELADPVRQAQIAGAASAVTETLLQMPAAPIARALAQIEGYDPDYIDPDLRLGDLVDPELADTPREFAYRLPQMMGAMAGLAAAIEGMAPYMRDLGERMAYPEPADHDIYDY